MRLKPEVVTKPTAEPVTLSEVKKQLEIASSDTSHDTHLTALIGAAREQWEHDTDSVTCFQTLRVRVPFWADGLKLPRSPIHSITSIQYYDGLNALQTLSASLYQLHVDEIRLAYLATLPATVSRWDAWTVTYKAGHSQDSQSVPEAARAAILMLAAHYFENRDMLMADAMQTMRPYEMLVRRFMRSSYP